VPRISRSDRRVSHCADTSTFVHCRV
jgi:hypothetical protein